MLDDQDRSGLSVAEYAEEIDVTAATLYSWRRRLEGGPWPQLFAGSKRGGEAAAILYSVIESCRLANVDRWEYLRDVLVRVATHPSSQIAERSAEKTPS